MKKGICLLVALLTLILPIAAASTRSPAVNAGIHFSGNTAVCSASARGDYANDRIELYAELWEGDSMVDTWEESGTGYVEWSRSFSATSGETYTLVAYATVNGRDLLTEYVAEVCP